MPKQFRPPRLRAADTTRRTYTIKDALVAESKKIDENNLLSPEGKLRARGEKFEPLYREIRGIRDAGRRRLAELEREHESLIGKSYSVRADAARREMMAELVREGRRDPAIGAKIRERVSDRSRTDEDTQELRRYMLQLDPLLSGLSEPHLQLIRMALEPTLPKQVNDIRIRAREIDTDIEDAEALMAAIASSVSREQFEELGVVGKPMSAWSPEERAAYFEKVGPDAFRADLEADMRFDRELDFGATPTSQAVDAEGRQLGAEKALNDPQNAAMFAPVADAAA